MVIREYGALRFSGLEADVTNLPIDTDLLGAVFNSTDTLKFWIFNGANWLETAGGGAGTDPTFDTVTFNLTTVPGDPTSQSIEWFETLDANNDVKHIKMKIDGAIQNVRYF